MNPPRAWRFGDFTLLSSQRQLLNGDKPLRVGGRALDLLIALVESAGSVVGRDELMARVWKKVVVDEGSLRVHVAALRRTLGDDGNSHRYIVNVPGRGYSFVAAVAPMAPSSAPQTVPDPDVKSGLNQLPSLLLRVVGRQDAIREVVDGVAEQRLVTIVGAAGIGKTTVAVAAATKLAKVCREGVRFVDLAPLSDPKHVPQLVASIVSDASQPVSGARDLGALLARRQVLIVLDNCEHVVEAAATVAEAILSCAPEVRLLATSREPIRAMGEWVVRLPSLGLPPASGSLSATQASEYAAVQLFIERASGASAEFAFGDDDVPLVTEICRRLDGIPLAIELAAGRVAQLGLRELAHRLEDRFAVLTKGRRTALPRQQTLRAAIDWSYDLLGSSEKAVLRRLSIFAGTFDFMSAVAICQDDLLIDNVGTIDELALKSLINIDISGDVAQYRLLEITRAYAREKLEEQHELIAATRRHALHVHAQFERLDVDLAQGKAVPLETGAHWIDDVRSAVQASFCTLGDPELGMRLLAATAALWFQHSLMDEYRTRAEEALENARDSPAHPDATLMRLWHALGHCHWHTTGPGPAMAKAFGRTHDLARHLHDKTFERMALWGLWTERNVSGDYAAALDLARQYAALTPPHAEPKVSILGGRMLTLSLHFMGHQGAARGHAETALALIRRHGRSEAIGQFQLDPQAATNAVLTRVLWIQGLSDQAMAVAEDAVRSALSTDHALTLCFALYGQCMVLIWCGRWEEAARQADTLFEVASSHRLNFWIAWAHAYRDAIGSGLEGVVAKAWRNPICGLQQIEFMATVDDRLLDDDVLARAEQGHCPWCAPEVFRAHGERLLRLGSAPAEAERWFERALELARTSNALSWELRTSTSLARQWLTSGRRAEAIALLDGVLARFSEGWDTADLARARRLLAG